MITSTENCYQKPKVGELLTAWDGQIYDNDGYRHIVDYISEVAEPWPGEEYTDWWFVTTKLLKADGKTGKRSKSFIVSIGGSIHPQQRSWSRR